MMDDCIFCQVVQRSADSWKIYETESAYAFLDIHPVSEYHTLVIPKNHYVNIFDVPEHELVQVVSALKHVVDLYHQRLGIENLQIVNSSGVEAQQDVFHLHFHIVPRHQGDQQDIRWSTQPDMTARFDQLIARLQCCDNM